MGVLLVGISMSIAGMVFAFIKGWSFAFVVFAAMPVVALATAFITKIL
jgi:hypothetical protein